MDDEAVRILTEMKSRRPNAPQYTTAEGTAAVGLGPVSTGDAIVYLADVIAAALELAAGGSLDG